jgi:hypothetical protein
MDGSLLAVALPFAPSNEVLVIDIAARRGWRLRHRHRRVLVTTPVFLPDGRLSLIVSPPPQYLGVSEIWIIDVRSGASSACISGRPAYLYRRPHFSADSTKCVAFREADDALYPWPEGRPRREYREPHPVSLFEIDLATRSEQRLSARAFENGSAFYAGDRDGYYLSTSDPLITTPPLWPGGPSGYEGPDFLAVLNEEHYPFNGFFITQGEEFIDRPTGVIPDALFDADQSRGSHAYLEDADYTGGLVISYQHPHPNAAFGLCISAAIVRGGEVVKRVELDGPRLDTPRISGDGQTVAGLLGARRENGTDVGFPYEDRPYLLVIDRDGTREFLSVEDIAFDQLAMTLQPHEHAEIV